MAFDNSCPKLEVLGTKFKREMQEILNDFKKNLLDRFRKIQKTESLFLSINIKSNMKLRKGSPRASRCLPSHGVVFKKGKWRSDRLDF